jgi:hypothetical protein
VEEEEEKKKKKKTPYTFVVIILGEGRLINVMLLAETFEMRKRLLTFSLVEPR